MNKFNLPYLFLDIGGTKTRIGLAFNNKSIEKVEIVRTPLDFREGINVVSEVSQEMLVNSRPGIIVAGIAGPLDGEKTKTVNPPNLPNWAGKPLKKKLERVFNAPVFLENDVVLGGLAEAVMGAGKGRKIVSYITISTGVNGIKIVDGGISENAYGFEIGHQIVDLDNSLKFGSSGRGELEDFISGREIAKRFAKDPSGIKDKKIWSEISRYVSICVYNTILYWSSDIIILGGSMMNKISIKEVIRNLKKLMTIFPELPEIKKAELGDVGGLYGGLCYLKNLVKG